MRQVRETGWAHHIQRLMILGSWALQRGYDAARNGLLQRIEETLARMRAGGPSAQLPDPVAAAGQN